MRFSHDCMKTADTAKRMHTVIQTVNKVIFGPKSKGLIKKRIFKTY